MLEAAHIGHSASHDRFLSSHGLSRLPVEDSMAREIASLGALSLQFPGEHCTECAAPDCHNSCDLFRRGPTGRCMRFEDGIVVRPEKNGPLPYSLEILFLPSGQVICVGNAWCIPWRRYRRSARLVLAASRASFLLQSALRFLPSRLQWRVTDKIRGLGNRVPRRLNRRAWRENAQPPDTLLCALGNPQPSPVRVEISVSGIHNSQGGRVFRRVVEVPHGWNVMKIPLEEIRPLINLRERFRLCVVPLIEEPALLQWYYVGFAAGSAAAPAQESPKATKKIKALVVDLDNTLWEGILIENPDRPRSLLPGCRAALEELDRRGILLSVASKNSVEDARRALTALGLWDLFLYPQIGWEPKSAGIRETARRLNIGLDAVGFVDDSEFERAEVRAALPEVRTWDAAELPALAGRAEFDVPVTAESRERRRLYREEETRQVEFEKSSLDYDRFLASCDIRLVLGPLDAGNIERVSELAQRTNQLNFSGSRYGREDLAGLLRADGTVPVVMRCEDRFGAYGIVGFSILKLSGDALTMSDLMFSCRIQGKKVEHGYLAYLLAQAAQAGLPELACLYNRTARNAPAGKVFDDLKFQRRPLEGNRERCSLPCGGAAIPSFPVAVVDEIGLRRALESCRNAAAPAPRTLGEEQRS